MPARVQQMVKPHLNTLNHEIALYEKKNILTYITLKFTYLLLIVLVVVVFITYLVLVAGYLWRFNCFIELHIMFEKLQFM